MQDFKPACSSWATLHAAYAVGREPSGAFAALMINAALRESYFSFKREGLGFFRAAGIVEEAPNANITYTPATPPSSNNILSMANYSRAGKLNYTAKALGPFIKAAIDDGSAVIAHIEFEDLKPHTGHAVCITGYDIAESGPIGLQVIDSAKGERMLTVDQLAREINKLPVTGDAAFAIVSPK